MNVSLELLCLGSDNKIATILDLSNISNRVVICVPLCLLQRLKLRLIEPNR